MATVLDIATDALQELGVIGSGEVANSDDAQVCLSGLNNVIGFFRLQPQMMFSNQQIQASLPANTQSLTIGTGLQIDVERPIGIGDGSFVRVGNLDYPLDFVRQADYNQQVTLKTLSGPWPRIAVYDDEWPTANVKFWPLGACTVNLHLQVPIASFSLITDVLSVPPGYQRVMVLTLMEEVAGKFGVQLRPDQIRRAQNARRVLKRSNMDVPQLDVGAPPTLPGRYAILGG